MIENKIQMLRRAAKVTSEDSTEEIWCTIAGNNKIINAVLFALTKRNYEIKLIFRKHVTVKSKHVYKKFDVIMLKGNPFQMNELIEISNKYGGAHIRITENYLKTEPNLMLIIGPDDNLRNYVKSLKNSEIEAKILLEDETHGFIETELKSDIKVPNYIKTVIDPIFDASDVIVGNVLISILNEKEIIMSKKLAQKNNIFLVDLEKLMISVRKKAAEKEKLENKNKSKNNKNKENKFDREEYKKNKKDSEKIILI